jgi:hypothetical protein
MFAGQAAQVTCLVLEGDTPLDIVWSVDGGSDMDELGIITNKLGQKGTTLFIEYINEQHRGNYTCTAKNPVGVARFSTFLEIHGKTLVIIYSCRECDFLFAHFLDIHALPSYH